MKIITEMRHLNDKIKQIKSTVLDYRKTNHGNASATKVVDQMIGMAGQSFINFSHYYKIKDLEHAQECLIEIKEIVKALEKHVH